jgi:hypothetical protein
VRLVKRPPEGPETSLGTLLMHAPLRALEISRTGCLLESHYPIEAGTGGRLRLAIAGRTYSEDVRITRCQRVEGSGAGYRLGVEFLLTRRHSPSSLRRAVYSMLNANDGVVFVDGPHV